MGTRFLAAPKPDVPKIGSFYYSISQDSNSIPPGTSLVFIVVVTSGGFLISHAIVPLCVLFITDKTSCMAHNGARGGQCVEIPSGNNISSL